VRLTVWSISLTLKESCKMEQNVTAEEENHCAAVQTRAMKTKEGKPKKPLNVTTLPGLDIGPEELIEQQKANQTLKTNQTYYNRRARDRRLNIGDSVLLLIPADFSLERAV